MNLTETPEGQVWPGQHKIIVGRPLGRQDIGDAPALVDFWEDGSIRVTVRLEPDSADLAELRDGGAIWVSFLGAPIRPFMGSVGKIPPKPVLPTVLRHGLPQVGMEYVDNLAERITDRGLAKLVGTLEANAKERGLAPDLVERMLTKGDTATLVHQAVNAGAAAALEILRELRAEQSKTEQPGD